LLAKVGKVVNNYMPYFTVTETAFSFYTSIILLSLADDLIRKCKDDPYARDVFGAKTLIAAMLVSGTIAYHITKFVANKLEGKDAFYATRLTNFVKDWDTQKNQTPAALHPLFDNLHQDYAGNNGKLSQSSIKSAQKVVDAIIATALIIQTA
jgi:hypothetical protein